MFFSFVASLRSSPDVPEGPYLELDGKRLSSEATITVREKEALTLRCVVTGASPAVRQMSWDLGDENVTHSSQLLMEYSAQEDNYASISVLAVNVTKELHTKMVTCRAEHIAWPRPAAISASLNVLCKYSGAFRSAHYSRSFDDRMTLLRCTRRAFNYNASNAMRRALRTLHGFPAKDTLH